MISIGIIPEENSRSSLLSDCTKGLVGGLSTKLDDKDEDSVLSTEGNLLSSRKGEKFRGGEVASHSCCSERKKLELTSRSLLPFVEVGCGPSVKSPL